jgi:lysozyme
MRQIITACNKALFASHLFLIWGLVSLVIGSSCNKSGLTANMETEQGNKRASIAAYEISSAGIALLKKCEGLRTEPYICPGGTLTVGYGQCIARKQFDSRYPNGFSEKDAEDLLRSSLSASYVPDIKRLIKVPLAQREFDMLVSLDYNVGAKVLSDPQHRMVSLINASNYEEASLAFPKFTKGGPEKKYYRGLLKRRMAEMFVFRDSASVPEALRAPIEDDNFRKITKCDSIAKYWEESRQQNLRDEAILLYRAYNDQSEAFGAAK